MGKKIVIISELFYPSTATTAHILTDVADALCECMEVEVITTDSLYDEYADADLKGETRKPYPITRINSKAYNKNKIFSRIYGLSSSSLKMLLSISRNVKKGDNVMVVTNPAPLLLLVSLLRRFKNFRLTIVVHDVFPENAVAAGIIRNNKNIFYKLGRLVFNKAYSSADNLVVLGRDMAKVVKDKTESRHKGPTVTVIENWSDSLNDSQIKTADSSLNEPLKILYAGNVGRVQGVDKFIDAFSEAGNENLRLEIRGDGAQAEEVKAKLKNLNTPHISFGEKYARTEQFNILSDCDIALVSLVEGMYGLGVPSKAYNIIEAGKPILFIGDPDSEIAMMVRENGIGYCFNASDREGIRQWLANLTPQSRKEFREMGRKARELSKQKYSKASGLEKFKNLFR